MEPYEEIQSLERARPHDSEEPILHHIFDPLSELKENSLENNVHFQEIIDARESLKKEILVNFNSEEKSSKIPQLSNESLNRMFQNLKFNSLIDISGEVSSGLSQMAMLLALEFAHAGRRILYVDGAQSFSRSLILDWNAKKYSPDTSHLSNIQILSITKYRPLMDFLEECHLEGAYENSVMIIDELTLIALANHHYHIYDDRQERKPRQRLKELFHNLYYTLGDTANRMNILTIVTRVHSAKVIKKIDADLSQSEQIDATVRIIGTGPSIWQVTCSNPVEELLLQISITD